MKFTQTALSLALAMAGSRSFASASTSEDAVNGMPPHHPPVRHHGMHPTLARFSSQFRCPYANEWLTKGAHRAAIDLGLTTPEKASHTKKALSEGHRARALQQISVMGSCSFSNQWTGPSCMEFRGEGWTEAAMNERCASEADSSLTMGGDGCPKPSELAGWCVKEAASSSNAFEATSMMISAMSDCDGNKMACESFVGGAFEADSGCGGGAPPAAAGAGGMDYSSMGAPVGGETKCILAPGAIGAAHQSGFSDGYSSTCPGTPAEGSPYMWPMAWSADVDTQSLAFGFDDVVHRNKGRTFYRLDKNWKRSDTLYSKGVRRGIGQGPCDNLDVEQSEEGIIACKVDMDVASGDPMETMIHRGSKMYFITWENSTDVQLGETDPTLIEECNYLDLAVIGNIRPDWFLDDRGDDTDVQYLGDQHVYYASEIPRLVKQWRKKDFASQYFTMSVAGNPPLKNSTGDDTIHWPLVLNIPGEGFGDDMLQVYQNHELLTDDDDDIFDLVQNLEASGGSCPLLTTGMGPEGEGDGQGMAFGPPVNEVHVPSNLEVDENSWFTSVYTFSPVWQPPMKVEEYGGPSEGVAVTEEGRVRVESCYDPSAKSVNLSVEFLDIETIPTVEGLRLPWLSVGYRESEICSMTPIGGGDSKIILVNQPPTQNFPKAYMGSMGPNTKRMEQSAIGSIYGSLWPLEDSVGYSGVSLSAPMLGGPPVMASRSVNTAASSTSVVLSFRQDVDEIPESMHLMYAIGMSPQIGIHTSRSCFEVKEFPTCSTTDLAGFSPPAEATGVMESETSSSSAVSTLLGAIVATIVSFALAL